MNIEIPSQLSDSELIAEVAMLATSERRTTAELVAHLAELEARHLHLRAGYPSLFVYCTEVLRLSEGGAYNRIEAAQTARRFPVVLDMLVQGALNLGTLRLLGPCLTDENHERLLAAASGKSKREVEKMLAGLFPRPDVADLVRKLPSRASTGPLMPGGAPGVATELSTPGADSAAPSPIGPTSPQWGGMPLSEHSIAAEHRPAPAQRYAVTAPLSADRYQFRFTGSADMHERFRRAQDLLRHAVPNGDASEIFDRALIALVADLERRKFGASQRTPRATGDSRGGSSAEGDGRTIHGRTIRAAVKRAVWDRDGGRCAYAADSGHRCDATAFLEFHHVIPYARGGPSTMANIQLRCRAHNGYEAELDFGRRELVPGRVEKQGEERIERRKAVS